MQKKKRKATKRKMRVLVVGGAGYVGGAVVDALLESNRYDARVYDNLLYEESYRKPVPFVFGDILDRKRLTKELAWADAVIWLAAIVGDGACKLDEVLTRRVNEESVAWLAKHFTGRIVFASTCSVYGAQEGEELLTEESAKNPLSLYAFTKIEAEKALAKSDAVIFRLGTLFGLSDRFSRVRMDLVVNMLTARALTAGEITVFGGRQYRPLLHVQDAGRAFVAALEHPKLSRGVVYNLSYRNMRVHDLARLIKKHVPKTKIASTKMPLQDTRNYSVSTKKVEKAMRFFPQRSIEQGIEEIKHLILERRVKNFNNPRYSNHLFLRDVYPTST